MLLNRSLTFCLLGLLLLIHSQWAKPAETLPCPFCEYTSEDESALQIHVNGHFNDYDVTINTNAADFPPAPERTSDIDDGQTVMYSIIPRLKDALSFSPKIQNIVIDNDIDFYGTGLDDLGWGADYRNIQMLLSSLLLNPKYHKAMNTTWNSNNIGRKSMASILEIQTIIEAAWLQGFDPEGGNFYKNTLANTREIIGSTEVVTLLAFLGIDTQLVDFHRPTSDDGHHPDMFNWVLDYFKNSEDKLPLFFQRDGNAHLIIGVEHNHTGVRLLILDPSQTQREIELLGTSKESIQAFRLGLKYVRAQQYQIVAIKGVYPTGLEREAGKMMNSLRIPSD